MKKKILIISCFCLFICLFVILYLNLSTHTDVSNISASSDLLEDKVISNEKYYKIVKTGIQEYIYYIYDSDKRVVEEQEIVNNTLDIELLDDKVVDISVGKGTGLTEHHYYSVDRDVFSNTYLYVLAYNNEKIAYINVPDDNSFENRHLVVRNVFDKSSYYQEYKIDFSKVDTPVINASFINNGSQLQITYLSDEQQEEFTKVVDLE